jgi:predicted double-glycine peptidase
VLQFWGFPDNREHIAARLQHSHAEPGGTRAGDLRDYARSKGLSAYVFEGSFDDVRHELEAGRPAIVGVTQTLESGRMLAHYRVVIGHHERDQRVLTMDPARGLLEDSVDGFVAEWQRSHQLLLVVFPPASRSSHH